LKSRLVFGADSAAKEGEEGKGGEGGKGGEEGKGGEGGKGKRGEGGVTVQSIVGAWRSSTRSTLIIN